MNKSILITGISGYLGLSIYKRIKNLDFENIYGCDVNPDSLGSGLVDRFFLIPSAVSEDFLSNLIEIINQHYITHLLVTTEMEIKIINQHRNRFVKTILIINEPYVTDIFLDKYLTAKYLSNKGLMVPKTYLVGEKIPKGKYILKLRRSSGSKFLQVFSELSDINHAWSIYSKDEMLVQEYIDSDNEYTATVFSNRKVFNTIIFKRKLTGGISYHVELVKDPIMADQLIKLAKEVNLFGSLNVQYKKFENLYYIFEVNPRISGSTQFKFLFGFDEINWWIEALEGNNISIFEIQNEQAIGVVELKYHLIRNK
jgi:carbamoyl-phosphate synthase large subunit